MKVYLENGILTIGREDLPSGQYKRTHVGEKVNIIEIATNKKMLGMDDVLASDLEKKDGTNYADYAEFKGATDAFFVKAPNGGAYTIEQYNEAIRKSIEPDEYSSYLPEGADFTTPSITAGQETKVLIPTAIKYARNFAVVDRGSGNFAIQYQGLVARRFKVMMATGMETGTNNVVVNTYMYREDVKEPGIGLPRKVGTGADVGALTLIGDFVAQPLDHLEIFVKVSLDSTVKFVQPVIIFEEY